MHAEFWKGKKIWKTARKVS